MEQTTQTTQTAQVEERVSTFRKILNIVRRFINFFPAVKNFIISVILTVILHYALIRFYVYVCAPSGLFGPFVTFFNMGSPVCVTAWNLSNAIHNHFLKLWSGIVVGSILHTFLGSF